MHHLYVDTVEYHIILPQPSSLFPELLWLWQPHRLPLLNYVGTQVPEETDKQGRDF